MKDQLFFLIIAFVFSGATFASETTQEEKQALSLGGYLETYYIHDFDHGSSETRPSFAYSHNRLGSPSINLAIIKAKLESENIRANLALGSGTYMRANYALEPNDLQKVFEAISGGMAGSRMLDLMGPKMVSRDFKAGIEARLHAKDFFLVKDASTKSHLDMPALQTVAVQLEKLMESGWGHDDTSSLLKVLEA